MSMIPEAPLLCCGFPTCLSAHASMQSVKPAKPLLMITYLRSTDLHALIRPALHLTHTHMKGSPQAQNEKRWRACRPRDYGMHVSPALGRLSEARNWGRASYIFKIIYASAHAG